MKRLLPGRSWGGITHKFLYLCIENPPTRCSWSNHSTMIPSSLHSGLGCTWIDSLLTSVMAVRMYCTNQLVQRLWFQGIYWQSSEILGKACAESMLRMCFPQPVIQCNRILRQTYLKKRRILQGQFCLQETLMPFPKFLHLSDTPGRFHSMSTSSLFSVLMYIAVIQPYLTPTIFSLTQLFFLIDAFHI